MFSRCQAARAAGWLLGAILLVNTALAQSGTEVAAPRIGQQPGLTRVVLDLAPGQTNRIEPLGAVLRIVLPGATLSATTKKYWRPEFGGYTLENRSEGATVNLVTPQGVSKRSGYRSSVLGPSEGKSGSRLVIDISGAFADTSPLPPIKSFEFVRAAGQRFTVVLDPGHGGPDPGARGYLTEEPLNLDVAKRVGAHLQAAGVDVIFTRSDNSVYSSEKSVDLATRAAQTRGKSVFVSIHANARPPRNANKTFGTEVYYYSPKRIAPIFPMVGALPEALKTSRIANLEPFTNTSNTVASPTDASLEMPSSEAISSETEVTEAPALMMDTAETPSEPEVYVPPAPAPLSPLLPDQSQTLAVNVLSSILGATAAYNGGVRNADYYVIKNAECPAILVEVGYVTHPVEGAQLKDTNYLDRIAYGVARGVYEYLENNSRAL